jgi:hypothetical protein
VLVHVVAIERAEADLAGVFEADPSVLHGVPCQLLTACAPSAPHEAAQPSEHRRSGFAGPLVLPPSMRTGLSSASFMAEVVLQVGGFGVSG